MYPEPVVPSDLTPEEAAIWRRGHERGWFEGREALLFVNQRPPVSETPGWGAVSTFQGLRGFDLVGREAPSPGIGLHGMPVGPGNGFVVTD